MPEAAKLLVLAGCALIAGIYGFLHARRYREGLPPLLDAFVSMSSFIVLAAGFILGGRIGDGYALVTEGRIAGLLIAMLLVRWFRARLGMEQARARGGDA